MAKKQITTGAPIHKIFLALAAKDGLGEDAGSAREGMTLNKGKTIPRPYMALSQVGELFYCILYELL